MWKFEFGIGGGVIINIIGISINIVGIVVLGLLREELRRVRIELRIRRIRLLILLLMLLLRERRELELLLSGMREGIVVRIRTLLERWLLLLLLLEVLDWLILIPLVGFVLLF